MKKTLILFITVLLTMVLVFAFCAVAYADAGTADDTGQEVIADVEAAEDDTGQTEFFAWSTLATYAGAVLFTTMVTQFIKKASCLDKVPTQVISYIIAVIGLLAGTYFSGPFTLNNAALCFVNGIIVAIAANGTYDNIKFTSLVTEATATITNDADTSGNSDP